MSESYWDEGFVQMLRADVVDTIEKAGEKAGALKRHFDKYFEKGITGYAFAITGRKRLIEVAQKPDAAFTFLRGGAWIYRVNNIPHTDFKTDFEIACMYNDGTISGQGRRRRVSEPIKQAQISLFSNGERGEPYDRNTLVCVAFDDEFDVVDVILGELVRLDETKTGRYDFVKRISLKSSSEANAGITKLEDLIDINLDEVAIQHASLDDQAEGDD